MSAWRKDFPIFKNSDVAYLDSASSAQKPQVVIDSYNELYANNYANIHRGLYSFSNLTTSAYENVRGKVAKFINAPSENEIIFVRNSTEAINLVAHSWGKNNLTTADEIILSGMEHHANIVPWQLLQDKIGFKIKIIPVLDNGALDYDAFKNLLNEKTKFIGVVHASNALGTINDVTAICKLGKKFNPDIKILIDGSQSAVHMDIDIQAIGCDFFCFTGHKIYGPNGVGVLWGKLDILNSMPPYQGGGDMIETVSFDKGTTYKSAPARFEAGTPAIAEAIALGEAIEFINEIGMNKITAHENELLTYMMSELNKIEGLTFYGTAPNKVGVVSFTADWAHASDLAMILDQCHVAVRSGHHCCMPLMERFKVDATVRASLGLYSNKDDVDALINGLTKAKRMLS